MPQVFYCFVERVSITFGFFYCPGLALAVSCVILIMMRETKESQVINVVVLVIVVEVRYLPALTFEVSV